jgi:D-amino-acid dehydrogenase
MGKGESMARTDAIVLGAGIVGTSIALHLVKRGLSVALIDRAGVGEQTSFGNAGIIEGNTIFPPAFPADPAALMRIVLKRAGEANYHLSFLPQALPWLLAFRAASRPAQLAENARLIRPLFARAVGEHEALMAESGAAQYLRKTGWLKIYRNERSFAGLQVEFDLAAQFGLPLQALDTTAAQALEPALKPVFAHAVFWPQAASVSNPFALTRAYAARFSALGGVTLSGDARSLHRSGLGWRVETNEGGVDAREVVVALGPWARELLDPLGLKLPLMVKRGYHRHFHVQGNAGLSRPVLDADAGYVITPMEQGLRMTTGVEIAARDAKPTPVQFERLLLKARELFPLGDQTDDKTWLGSRPCFPDSRPVIGRAPGLNGLWLAIGHAHWGLTLGPATGRMVAEMISGATPFCDPAPYRAERFL